MKAQHELKLVGVLQDGSIAKTHQADLVVQYQNKEHKLRACTVENKVCITTPKGVYMLDATSQNPNMYMGICKDSKTHVILKKTVGKLIYWA
jgi:hypothetical protein